MKKSVLLLGAIGIGAGVAYALSSNQRVRGNTAVSDDGKKRTSRNGRSRDSTSDNGFPKRAGSSTEEVAHGVASANSEVQPEIDDRGTDQVEAAEILKNIRDAAFDSSDEKLALALGRPTQEIEAWTSGSGIIDGDVVMKARGLAIERGLDVGQ